MFSLSPYMPEITVTELNLIFGLSKPISTDPAILQMQLFQLFEIFSDTLQDQLCTTLMHLAVMIEKSDISDICAVLKEDVKELNEYLSSYHRKIVHRLNKDELKNSSLNSSSELSRTDKSDVSSSQIGDALYEYIVAKPPTDSEKLVVIREAVAKVCSVTTLDDCNENDICGEMQAQMKHTVSQADCSMLFDAFYFQGCGI